MTFTIKQGDTSPNIILELQHPNGAARSIAGYENVALYMRDKRTAELIIEDDIDGGVIINDAKKGEVEYDWSDGDTDHAGTFQLELEVTFSDGKIETFPNSRYITVEIVDNLQ